MTNWINELKRWREDRDIVVSSGQYVQMVTEELGEYTSAKNIDEKIDAIADIVVLSTNELALEGYDMNKVMLEVAKEINSRQQCPEQANRNWKGLEKWKKDKNQDSNTLYKAEFTNCIIY